MLLRFRKTDLPGLHTVHRYKVFQFPERQIKRVRKGKSGLQPVPKEPSRIQFSGLAPCAFFSSPFSPPSPSTAAISVFLPILVAVLIISAIMP